MDCEDCDDDRIAADDHNIDYHKFIDEMMADLSSPRGVKAIKQAINLVINKLLNTDKQHLFGMRKFFDYCVTIMNKTIDEPSLFKIVVPSLDALWNSFSDVCFQWGDLTEVFQYDYRWFDNIHLSVERTLARLRSINADNYFINNSVPLMLSSMITTVSVFYTLKDVMFIVRPILEMIKERANNGLCVDSIMWFNVLKQIADINQVFPITCSIIDKDKDKDSANICQFVVYIFDKALGNDKFLSLISRKALNFIAKEFDVKLEQLFMKFQVEISQHIFNNLNINSSFDINYLFESMSLFGIQTLPKELLKYIIPPFAIKYDEKTKLVLDEISKIQEGDITVIELYLKEIICLLFYDNTVERDAKNIIEVINNLSLYSNVDVEDLIRKYALEINALFLYRLSDNYYPSVRGLAFIKHFENNLDNKFMNLYCFYNDNNSLKDYLKPHYLGFIHKFDAFMLSRSIDSEKLLAVKSFTSLLELMGSDCVTELRIKIFATLKLIIDGSNDNNLKSQSLEAIMKFIKIVDNSYLSTQLLSISALILPQMHFVPQETSQLYKELIISRKSDLLFQNAFKHLYFIPDVKELHEVNKTLKPFIISQSENIYEAISLVVSNVNHENSKVQIYSLRELLKLLKKQYLFLYKLCIQIKEESRERLVNDIIKKFMFCLSSTEDEVLLLITECLGVIGAIDPTRIDLDKPFISKEDIYVNLSEDKFKNSLITILMHAVNTAQNTVDQDCASYALKEILKYYKISDGNTLPDLPQHVQDYCKILQRSTYQALVPTNLEQLTLTPIFDLNSDLSYFQWLTNWMSDLYKAFIFTPIVVNCSQLDLNSQNVSQISGSSVEFENKLREALSKQNSHFDVLKFCYHALQRNLSIAQFLLPFVVINSLERANDEKQQLIVNEVKTVITKLTNDEYIICRDIAHQTSQTVFSLYDHLIVWQKKRKMLHKSVTKTPRHLRDAQKRDRQFKGVQYFLKSISSLELAKLAYNCNAYSRALRYLEDHIKESADIDVQQKVFQREISFFQKIFVKLNDPDSVEGCNSKRIDSASIRENILTHEAIGQIQEAQICCSKAVHVFPNDFEFHRKYLSTSMVGLDQTELVFTYGMGLMIRQPEWRRKVSPFVIEAAWKLGNWDELDKLLNQHIDGSFSTFGSGVGDLLFSIKKKKPIAECEAKLTNLRQQIIGPLSAAAMEDSGYVRGHQFIVNLHILHDIQLVISKFLPLLTEECCEESILKKKFSKVIKIWNDRNLMVKNTINCFEPILDVQRCLLSIIEVECDFLLPAVKKQRFISWLNSTKTSRKAGNIQRSYTCLLEMRNAFNSLSSLLNGDKYTSLSDLEISEALSESAKVHWNRGDKSGAMKYLKDEIGKHFEVTRHYCYMQAGRRPDNNKFTPEELNEFMQSLSIDLSNNTSSSSIYLNFSTNSHISNNLSNINLEKSKAFAKLQLLYTKYCDNSGTLNYNTLLLMYKSVTIANPKWEEGYYSLGMYCNKLSEIYEESYRKDKTYTLAKPEEILILKGGVVNSFAESLKYGAKHVHISLPRLLNIWFELATAYNQQNSNSSKIKFSLAEMRTTLDKITKIIEELIENIPSYLFFIAFNQLTSRMLHPYSKVSEILKKIIAKLINDYPQQSMWLLMRSLNSYNLNRRQICLDIVNFAINRDITGSLKKFFNDINSFANCLQEFCNQKLTDANKNCRVLSMKKHFPKMAQLFSRNRLLPILLPFHSLINVTLPPSSLVNNYNPFPLNQVFIEGFDDSVDLLLSLQKPKKITILGSDGNRYTMLCKNGDDLRKDGSLLDFSNLLNRCLKRDSETRRRQLKIKTYLVVPLSDSCGLIEWIPGLMPFRTIIESFYRSSGDYDDFRNIVSIFPDKSLSNQERIKRFKKVILPKVTPPVFSQWFVSNYSDPLSWFSARSSYTRTSAVISVIGYLLGLGDRHGENILIEENSGQTVHVDYNCLFNKGEDFGVPEKVPFRLTHNMIHAMGPTGYEGNFRKACEQTLRVARENQEALINFFNPFRYDHLNEYSQRPQTGARKSFGDNRSRCEFILEEADDIVSNIEARLSGIPSRNAKKKPKGIPLSVEGQVDHIIKESIDDQNLGLMYIGWAPYL